MHFIKKFIGATGLGLAVLATVASGSVAAQNTESLGYRTLDTAQHVKTDGKKVEVTEFFFYACPHCNMFEPHVAEWVKKQGGNIEFKRVPVAFGNSPPLISLQKLYYGLEAMGKLEEIHPKVFRAIHVERQQLNNDEQIATFLSKHGVDKQKYMDVIGSMGVQAKVRQAASLTANYKVDMVPLVAVNGRYLTSPSLAGPTSTDQSEPVLNVAALKIMDSLVAKSLKK